MDKVRQRAAQMGLRWRRNGYRCELSTEELIPFFAVYFDEPRGKVVIQDRSKPITLTNLKAFSATGYRAYQRKQTLMKQAQRHFDTLIRLGLPMQITVADVYALIKGSQPGEKKTFSLKDPRLPVTVANVSLLIGGRSAEFEKLRKNADRKMAAWRRQGLEPEFTLGQFTRALEMVGYQSMKSIKGIRQQQRICILDHHKPLILANLTGQVKAKDSARINLV